MCVFDHLDVSHVSMMFTVNSVPRPEDNFFLVVVFPFYYFFHTVHESCLFAGFQTRHRSSTPPSLPNFVFTPSLLKNKLK